VDQNAIKLYESLYTIEEMLTEVVAECATASKLAKSSNLSEISDRLQAGLLRPLQIFLDGKTPTSMATLIEIADGIPAPRLTETTPQQYEDEDDYEEDEQPEQYEERLSHTGNPKYDDMFNKLFESSIDIEQTGRIKFKLDEIGKPSDQELEKPISALPAANNPPRLPGQKEKVEFDGMENWRSILKESSSGPSRLSGGDAGDIAHTLMNLSENDVEGLIPTANPPKRSNASVDLDPDIDNILSNL
jgi:hypothetical protein